MVATVLISCFGLAVAVHDPARRHNAIGDILVPIATMAKDTAISLMSIYMEKKKESHVTVVEAVSAQVDAFARRVGNSFGKSVKELVAASEEKRAGEAKSATRSEGPASLPAPPAISDNSAGTSR